MKRTNLAAALSLATLASNVPLASAQYTAYDLGTLGGTASFAYGINSSGTIVGQSATSNNAAYHAFSYSGGVMRDLGTLPGGTVSVAYAINSSGTIAGASYTNGSSNPIYLNAFSYSGGVMTDLGTLGGNYSRAYGINNS